MPRTPAFVGGGRWIDNDGNIVNADKVEVREFCRGVAGMASRGGLPKSGKKDCKGSKVDWGPSFSR
jgi:hypothetical protein